MWMCETMIVKEGDEVILYGVRSQGEWRERIQDI